MSTNTLVLGLFEYDPTTDANLPFSITDALNNNWDKIDSLVPLLSTIAAPFNPEQSYAVGAYCTYQGNLQRCNTNIPTGEVWNPSHWDAVTIMSQSVNSGQINQPNGVAGLNEQSQLDSSVIPPLDYDPAGSSENVQNNLNNHINDQNNPHKVTAEQVGADPSGSASTVQENLTSHINNQNNPHNVTASQVGADPIGSANTVQQNLTTHINNTENPHQVTSQQIGALLAIAAAAAYNPSGTYAVGDYCTNFGNLYKCNTPIPDGEPWNAAHWTATTVAKELEQVHGLLSPLGGATTPQAALAALGAGVRPNLLDNAIFVGGGTVGNLPVNQQKQSSYAGTGRWFDRWIGIDSTCSCALQSDGISLASDQGWCMYETLSDDIKDEIRGKTVTASVLSEFGLDYFVINNALSADNAKDFSSGVSLWLDPQGSFKVGVQQSAKKIYAAKLDLGNSQTLAYQDSAGTWHLLPQPGSDYATQLLKCQSYQFNVLSGDEYGIIGNGLGENANGAYIFVPTPTTLRRKPSLLFSGSFKLASDEAPPYDSMVITDIAVERYTNHGVTLICKAPEGKSITLGKPYSLWVTGDPDALFLFDANIV